ncbi:uncharacterized protein LOC106013464 [Aplysia californica]|uniref:Uncharacterized protein LOC106013464 n=1 Tax=Aplysia californica TaxID=6500 RepID=A0ABM1ABW3_APLCA|nr:uncharacterized protein LOC106013464 [Aplysia californica]
MTTAHNPLLQPPLSSLDVTRHDHIWKRAESPIVNGEKRHLLDPLSDGAVSPPLKHITSEWTRQLVETFDPLDVVDSSSERSASSADTMIMMTTEEERRNEESIKSSLLDYKLRRALSGPNSAVALNSGFGSNSVNSSNSRITHPSKFGNSPSPQFGDSPSPKLRISPSSSKFGNSPSPKFASSPSPRLGGSPHALSSPQHRRGVPNNYVSSQQMLDNARRSRDSRGGQAEGCGGYDEGYGTDSRSNTSASISSPLSSSLSSLSTLEGSQNLGQHLGGGGYHHHHHLHHHNPQQHPYQVHQQYQASGNNSNISGNINHNNNNIINSNNVGSLGSVGAMQRGPIQKGPQLQGNSRMAGGPKLAGMAVKRRDVPVEAKESNSNLEDRLRALTTIEEEESGLDRTLGKARVSSGMSELDKGGVSGQHFSRSRDWQQGQQQYQQQLPQHHRNSDASQHRNGGSGNGVYGCFRAVPVEIKAPDVSGGLMRGQDVDENERGMSFRGRPQHRFPQDPVPPPPASQQVNGDGWRDYKRYFEKDCDIPAHNIDPAGRGKFSNSSTDNVPDMDINRQIGTGSPAYPKKHMDMRYQSSEQRSRESPYSVPRVDAGGASDHHPLMAPTSRSSYPANHSRGLGQSSRPAHVMSSMPDLRSQEPSWTHGMTPRPHQDSYPGYPFHPPPPQHDHRQQQRQQQQQHPSYSSSPRQQRYQDFEQHQQLQQQYPSYSPSPHLFMDNDDQGPSSLPASLSGSQYSGQYHEPHGAGSSSDHPSNDPSGPLGVSQGYPEVVLRRSRLTASARAAPGRPDRYSWQPGSTYHENQQQQLHLSDLDRNVTPHVAERASLDLGSIPQLQKQIRATSELCLQASRRHMFASSADIYKLFSGQRRTPASSSSSAASTPVASSDSFGSDARSHSMRHSFHSVPAGGWGNGHQHYGHAQQTHKDSPGTRPKLRVMDPLVASPGPVRADHNISIPPEAWTNVTATAPTSQSQPTSDDRPPLQRQSSGYSSENELQQIEINAKAAKKLHKKHGHDKKTNPQPSSAQEFIPLNRSADGESTADDEFTDNGENEPVYMNQPMLSRARNLDAVDKSSTPSESPRDRNLHIRPEVANPPRVSHGVPLEPHVHILQANHHSTPPPLQRSSSSAPICHPPHLSASPTSQPQYTSASPAYHHHQPNSTNPASISQFTSSILSSQPHYQQVNPTSHPQYPSSSSTHHLQQHPASLSYSSSPAHATFIASVPEAAITQNQVINLHSRPVTITSHVPSNPFYTEDNDSYDSPLLTAALPGSTNPYTSSLHNSGDRYNGLSSNQPPPTNRQNSSPAPTSLLSTQQQPPQQSNQRNPSQFVEGTDPRSRNSISNSPKMDPSLSAAHVSSSRLQQMTPPLDQAHPRPFSSPSGQQQGHLSVPTRTRPGSSSSVQLSPVELAQMLDVPFETNIISDESGDRLSTLV